MKQMTFFRMLELSELGSTSKDLTPLFRPPSIDWSRTFTLWNEKRERDALYVFLDTGEAVMTWCSLASLAGLLESELHERTTDVALPLMIHARHGDVTIPCVRIDLVEAFLSEIERA
jgi:hypothetical protein